MCELLKQLFCEPSVLVGFLALIVSIIVTVYTIKSFKLKERALKLKLKPFAAIMFYDYENLIQVFIENVGTGALIIKSIKIYRNNQIMLDKALIDLMPQVVPEWSNFIGNADNAGFVIISENSLTLLKIDDKNKDFNIHKQSIRKSLNDLKIEIIYTSIFEDEVFITSRSLDWFGRTLE